jgi:hypothetical protein
MTGLLILIVAGVAFVAWWRLLHGKELARRAAALVCREHGLVLMDDTVMLDSIQLKREAPVHAWGLRYRFDFAQQGVLRHGGVVLLTPGQPPTVIIQTDNGQVIEPSRPT